MTDRERFEEWAEERGEDLRRIRDGYYSWVTMAQWNAWQAALAAERKRLKEALMRQLEIAREVHPGQQSKYAHALDWAIQQIEEDHE